MNSKLIRSISTPTRDQWLGRPDQDRPTRQQRFEDRQHRPAPLFPMSAMLRINLNPFHAPAGWLLLAALLIGTAAWQVRVADRHSAGGHEIVSLPPPLKTRQPSRRPEAALAGNPLAAYRARFRQGLDEKEIEWILNDFRAVGLDQPPGAAEPSDYLAYRRTQQRWYLDALTDALQLTPSQTAAAKARLESLYQPDAAAYLEMIDAIEPITLADGRSLLIGSAHDFNSILYVPRWINGADGAFLPRNLCQLSPEQEEILTGGVAKDLPTSFEQLENLLPFSGGLPADVLEDSPWNDEVRARVISRLHPAHLKLLLLFEPDLVDRIDHAAGDFSENLPIRSRSPERDLPAP